MASDEKGYIPPKTFPCIRRSDGYICMGNEKSLQLGNGDLIPFDGDVNLSPKEALAYLRKGGKHVTDIAPAASKVIPENALADITRMDKGELIEYAMDEYGLNFGGQKLNEDQMRAKILERRKELAEPRTAAKPSGLSASA